MYVCGCAAHSPGPAKATHKHTHTHAHTTQLGINMLVPAHGSAAVSPSSKSLVIRGCCGPAPPQIITLNPKMPEDSWLFGWKCPTLSLSSQIQQLLKHSARCLTVTKLLGEANWKKSLTMWCRFSTPLALKRTSSLVLGKKRRGRER